MSEKRPLYAMAFIDGQNLFQHAMDAFGHYHPNYDPLKLHSAVCESQGWQSNLVRFYTGVPDAVRDPMWAGYWSNRVLAMKRAGIVVTTRPLRYREREAYNQNGELEKIVVPQEKGIDVRLALDIVRLARLRQFDVAVLYSQDQDLNEIVEEVRDIGKAQEREIIIASAFPDSDSATYRRGVNKTQWVKIDRPTYDACLDAKDYRPTQFR